MPRVQFRGDGCQGAAPPRSHPFGIQLHRPDRPVRVTHRSGSTGLEPESGTGRRRRRARFAGHRCSRLRLENLARALNPRPMKMSRFRSMFMSRQSRRSRRIRCQLSSPSGTSAAARADEKCEHSSPQTPQSSLQRRRGPAPGVARGTGSGYTSSRGTDDRPSRGDRGAHPAKLPVLLPVRRPISTFNRRARWMASDDRPHRRRPRS